MIDADPRPLSAAPQADPTASSGARADVLALFDLAIQIKPRSGAVFSPGQDPLYRYALWRALTEPGVEPARWLAVIMLNPSTADHTTDDPTMRSVRRLATANGYDGVLVANLFALRTPSPQALKQHEQPVGPLNDAWIDAVAARGSAVVAAWGANGVFRGRGKEVAERLAQRHDLLCFRETSGGSPEHPLYLPTSVQPAVYRSKVEI